jgi:hypothetical protein
MVEGERGKCLRARGSLQVGLNPLPSSSSRPSVRRSSIVTDAKTFLLGLYEEQARREEIEAGFEEGGRGREARGRIETKEGIERRELRGSEV